MARQTDHLKFQAWQSRLERHVTSGLSVARFCSAERVSVATSHIASAPTRRTGDVLIEFRVVRLSE